MRISRTNTITNGFKKWSNAQRPVEQPTPAINVPEPRRQKGELARPDAGIVGNGK
jgi:hypothetical protein